MPTLVIVILCLSSFLLGCAVRALIWYLQLPPRNPRARPLSRGQIETRAAAEAYAAHHPRVVTLRFVRRRTARRPPNRDEE